MCFMSLDGHNTRKEDPSNYSNMKCFLIDDWFGQILSEVYDCHF